MTFKITYHKDVLGGNYLAIDIPKGILTKYFIEMREDLHDLEVFDRYIINRDRRDNNACHITIVNAMNLGKLIDQYDIVKFTEISEEILNIEISDIKMMGLGSASRGENTTYFVVVKSNTINDLLNTLGITPFGLHITLGFEYSDVFGVPKNEVIERNSQFKQELSSLFYSNNESFEFIRNLKGFTYDGVVNAINITNTRADFRIGDFRYITISLVDDVMTITNAWEETKTKPILSHTIIYRKLKSK